MLIRATYLPFIITALGLPVWTQMPQEAASAAQPMRFEIVPRPGVRGYVVGSIAFEARFTNGSDKEVFIPWQDTLYEDMFIFTVTGPDGVRLVAPKRRMTPPVLRAKAEFVQVPAGTTVTYDVVLGTYGRNVQPWYLRHPGEYTVEAEYISERNLYVDPATGGAAAQEGVWQGRLKSTPVKVTLGPAPAAQEITGRLAGIVIDPEGRPIAGAVVDVMAVTRTPDGAIRAFDGDAKIELDRRETDAEGRFTIEGLPEDSFKFTLKATHQKFAPITLDVGNQQSPARLNATLRMSPGVPVRGRVTDAGGQPIHGVHVRCYPADKIIFTDREGRFEFEGAPPDNLHVDFFRPGYELKNTGLLTIENAKNLNITMARKAAE